MLKHNKQIVLALMSGSDIDLWPVSRLIMAAELFGIQSASLRVVLGRLLKEGTINQTQRGVYKISDRGKHMQDALQRWSRFDELVKPWTGQWYACYTAHLGRVDRKSVVKRERALALNGFESLEQGLWVRPDNLLESMEAFRSKLLNLGLEKEAYVMRVEAFPAEQEQKLKTLWDATALEKKYRELADMVDQSYAELPELPVGDAAKQSLEIGHLVVTSLGFDPLLPEQMINTTLRSELVGKMQRYDDLSQRRWREFYESTLAHSDVQS